MNHTIKLFSARKPVQHWKDVIRRQDEMTELLRKYVKGK